MIRVTVTRCPKHCHQIKGFDPLYAKMKKDGRILIYRDKYRESAHSLLYSVQCKFPKS